MTTWAKTLEQHKSRQRDLILDAAGEIFSEKGISGLSISALASRAGMTRPTLYNYFSDVDAVIIAYGRREIGRRFEELRQQLEAEKEPVQRIEKLARFMVSGDTEHEHQHEHEADWMKYVPGDSASHDEYTDPIRALLAESVNAGVEQGLFRSDVDPDQVARVLLDLAESIHMMTHTEGNSRHFADMAVDFTFRILAP